MPYLLELWERSYEQGLGLLGQTLLVGDLMRWYGSLEGLGKSKGIKRLTVNLNFSATIYVCLVFGTMKNLQFVPVWCTPNTLVPEFVDH